MTGWPICPICDCYADAKETQYGTRYSCCDLWSWNGAPLADADTHEARKDAHAAFDALWKVHGMSRSEAYAALSEELGIHPDLCHMKLMDEETARRAEVAAINITQRLLRAKFRPDDDFEVLE